MRAAAAVEQRIMSILIDQLKHMRAVGEKVDWPYFAGLKYGAAGLVGAMYITYTYIDQVEKSLTRENEWLKRDMKEAKEGIWALKY